MVIFTDSVAAASSDEATAVKEGHLVSTSTIKNKTWEGALLVNVLWTQSS